MSCKCSSFDEDNGRYSCAVSGDECALMFPDSKVCAELFGEGPDVDWGEEPEELQGDSNE